MFASCLAGGAFDDKMFLVVVLMLIIMAMRIDFIILLFNGVAVRAALPQIVWNPHKFHPRSKG